MSESYRQYTAGLEKELERLINIGEQAREKGLDPSLKIESRIAMDLADLVEGLVGPAGVAASIRELSLRLPREELAFKTAEEIIYGKFGHFEAEPAAEQAIRTALAIFTEGLTAAPIQGVSKVSVKTNGDRSKYLAIYFAGPIRAAGGTDQALTLVLGDFVRRLLGLDRYKPTEDEVSRFIEELRIYERSVTRFQYHIPDAELRKALQWLPVEVTGPESDPVEVSSFRNLPRVETNRVRGGALRVVNDGIVGRAPKVLTIVEKLGFQGWDWLKEFGKKSQKKSGSFMDDVIAGRPVFSFPARKGGFRLRYGRARNTGLSAVGVHPATMLVLQDFLAAGTQMRLELPGKGGVAIPVDSIEPPIVRLDDGSVVRVTVGNFRNIAKRIDKILFLGDLLVSFGDFLYNSKMLSPSSYVEEWWRQNLHQALAREFNNDLLKAEEVTKISASRIRFLLNDSSHSKPSFEEAALISDKLGIPLHPAFTFFWSGITSTNEIALLLQWFKKAKVYCGDGETRRIVGENLPEIKTLFEGILLPHLIVDGEISVEGEDAQALAFSLGFSQNHETDFSTAKSVLEAVNILSGVSIREKACTFIGARMGRPEKAKRREMRPLVHVIFPIGLSGGSQRDIIDASKKGPTFVEVVKRKCPQCGIFTFRVRCASCGCKTIVERSCPRCGKALRKEECPNCKIPGKPYQRQAVNLKGSLDAACSRLSVSMPKALKGVKGLTNETKTPEIIEKGVLRARHDMSVYKDGTIRFDTTNAPLTHFRPREVDASLEKLRELGYTYDVNGKPLIDSDQVLELHLQDVIIPSKCAEYFLNETAFLDDLLSKIYGLPPFYRVKQKNNLIGHLIVGLAPHTCVGILGRIIGFTSLSVCYAHPVWHSAKRRDCDGDEDTLMLALDVLVNFSREYLPAQIGGIMDAPLLLIPIVKTRDVQRQAHDFDVALNYPIEFYEKTQEKTEARYISSLVDSIGNRLGTDAQFEGFNYTNEVSDINIGNDESVYKQLKTMVEKLNAQLDLAERILAVDAEKVALKVLSKHFMRDIAGNLRAFSTQAFRCKSCNKHLRRIPLRGKCPACGGLISLTVYRGGIEKYLQAAQNLVDKYDLPDYYSQRISLVKEEIRSLFDNGKPKQISLTEFA
jgi:DNA polymerase II large subunit